MRKIILPFVSTEINLRGEKEAIEHVFRYFRQFGNEPDKRQANIWEIEMHLGEYTLDRHKPTVKKRFYSDEEADFQGDYPRVSISYKNTLILIDHHIVVIESPTIKELQKVAFLLTRSIMEKEYFSAGFSLYHGGVFEIDNIGYLVTGNCGSGKTTLLFDFLINGATFITGDRVFLKIVDDKLIAVARPGAVRIRIKTALHFNLKNYVPSEFLLLPEKRIISPGSGLPKLEFQFLLDLIGCQYKNSTQIKNIIFAAVDNPSGIESIEKDKGLLMLAQAYMEESAGLNLSKSIFDVKSSEIVHNNLHSKALNDLSFTRIKGMNYDDYREKIRGGTKLHKAKLNTRGEKPRIV